MAADVVVPAGHALFEADLLPEPPDDPELPDDPVLPDDAPPEEPPELPAPVLPELAEEPLPPVDPAFPPVAGLEDPFEEAALPEELELPDPLDVLLPLDGSVGPLWPPVWSLAPLGPGSAVSPLPFELPLPLSIDSIASEVPLATSTAPVETVREAATANTTTAAVMTTKSVETAPSSSSKNDLTGREKIWTIFIWAPLPKQHL
ncbi:MAG: hypothetical protein ABJI96_20995 [Paracoccaceae bacterium]